MPQRLVEGELDELDRGRALRFPGGRLRREHRVDERQHRGAVELAVLDVDPCRPVREHDERHRLVEPTVAAVAVQQVVARVLRVGRGALVEADAEQCGLHRVERVGVAVEKQQGVPALGPLGAGLGGEVADRELGGRGARVDDRPQPVLQIGHRQRLTVRVDDVHAEEVAPVEHGDVPSTGRAGLGVAVRGADGVLPGAGDARGGEQVPDLVHGQWPAPLHHRRDLLGVEA